MGRRYRGSDVGGADRGAQGHAELRGKTCSDVSQFYSEGRSIPEVAGAVQRSHRDFGHVDCYHVSSKLSTGERKAELDRFRDSKNALITNAKCLTEGVDVPTIDAVLFADTKRSTIDIVQAAGRALRPADGKKLGYIVVPVVVDEDDPEAADKAFQDILMVLRAMASNDDRIIDYFRSVSRGNRIDKSDGIVEFIVSDPIKIRLENFVENIENKSWHRLARLSWMPFEEAREFAQSLNLKNHTDWTMYCHGRIPSLPPKPNDIPVAPDGTYKDKGWTSWGDWLGTGAKGRWDCAFRPFEDARAFVWSLGLKSAAEWQKYARGQMPDLPRKPTDVPSTPARTYKNQGWLGWGDWLGTGTIASSNLNYRIFQFAREFAQSLNLGSKEEWIRYCKGERPDLPPVPDDIPRTPNQTYKDKGWVRWGDWVGTGRIGNRSRVFRRFEDARVFARSLNVGGYAEWFRYCKGKMPDLPPLPDDIPTNPNSTYKDKGWVSWGDWSGTGKIARKDRTYRKFEDARQFVRSLNLENQTEWTRYYRGERPDLPSIPDDIPRIPREVYKDEGWVGFGDWLGTGRIANFNRVFRSFENARMFARSLNLRSQAEWHRYYKGERPDLPPVLDDIPHSPSQTYKDKGWLSWGDWLGKN